MEKSKDILGLHKSLSRLERQQGETPPTPERVAERLNEETAQFGAGFYPSAVCSRAFGARVRGGRLEITPDFRTWHPVDLATITFTDHGGRPIFF